MTNEISYQQLLNTNFNTINYGYTGSRGDIGYTGSGYPLSIANVQITYANFAVSTSNTISTTGGFLKLTGAGFETGCNVFYSNTIVPATEITPTVSSSQEVRLTIGTIPTGIYNLFLYNPTGTTAIKLQAFTVA